MWALMSKDTKKISSPYTVREPQRRKIAKHLVDSREFCEISCDCFRIVFNEKLGGEIAGWRLENRSTRRTIT
jgi:hypothetical protein